MDADIWIPMYNAYVLEAAGADADDAGHADADADADADAGPRATECVRIEIDDACMLTCWLTMAVCHGGARYSPLVRIIMLRFFWIAMCERRAKVEFLCAER